MGLIKNAINFGNGFNIGAVAPIDSRMRVELLSDLTTVWTAEIPAYKGMIVTVMETSDVYVLKDVDNYTNIASWVKLGSADAATTDTANALKEAKEYTDTEVGKLANGSVKTNTEAIAKLNGDAETEGSVAKAVATEQARALVAEKANADAIAAETTARTAADDAIKAKIGEVPADKTVVGMIEDAQAAAKAAATKMKLATDESFLTLEPTTDEAGAITYTLGTKDLASDDKLQDEIDRAKKAESDLTTAIEEEADRALAAEGGLAKRITSNEKAIATLNGDAETEGSVAKAVATEQARALVAEKANADAISTEKTRAEGAESTLSGRIDVIEGEGEGSIKKAVADAKAALEGTLADTDAKTLAALNDRIDAVVTNAKTYSIAKATTEEAASLGTNVKEAYKLVDEDDVKVGVFIPVYKDSALQEVKLVGQELQFTYLLADGTKDTVSVDVSKFLAETEFKNGLIVNENGEVSVKVDAASEAFLTVGADGVKLAGVQEAINAAKKAVTDRLDVIEGEGAGSIKKAVADAKAYADAEIDKLDAEVTSTDGSHVTVKVTEVDGVITAVNVTESNIASASATTAAIEAEKTRAEAAESGLTADIEAEIGRATNAETALAGRLDVLEGDDKTVGSVAKAVADAKAALLGDAAEDYNTLGKLKDKVIAAEAAAKAAATKIDDKTDGHVTVSVAKDENTGALTYTISESDIASAKGLADEVSARTSADDAIKGRLDVLEGVTVTGEDAIVVSKSDAKENKKVSLKLGTQPAEGEAGIVLSQDANGLVAKLLWGTF